MITLTNAQLNAFNNPQMRSLLSDPQRQFPIKVAFALHELINEVQKKLQAYNTVVKKLLDDNGVTVDPKTGMMIFPKKDGVSQLVMDELKTLNELEVEIAGKKLALSEDWPKMTVFELAILRPFIDGE
jgi:hypothetical protein